MKSPLITAVFSTKQASDSLPSFFLRKAKEYNRPFFIEKDPVCVPHQFEQQQDIEIAGFFAAVFAWGNRTTIIAKTRELMALMDHSPHEFMLHHKESDRKALLGFKHRTFTATDLIWFVHILQNHYRQYHTLETAFFPSPVAGTADAVKNGLIHLQQVFFNSPHAPARTRKHLSSPERNSGCKRLNMFLRWMVREDNNGVDFGLWKNIRPADLIIPIDLHVARVAKRFGLMDRKQPDWLAAEALTAYFRRIDPEDPAQFDFALFGLGVLEKY